MKAADALLTARLCAGDDTALAEVIDALGPSVYASAVRILGRSVTAQDVVQDVFVDFWSHPDRYNPDAGTLRTYLVMLARHRAIDLARSELRRAARQERQHRLDSQPPPASPGDRAETTAAASAVHDAVNQLPDGQRLVVELAYFQGMTFREVAAVTGLPEGTVKSRLRLAFAKLEHMLDRTLLESS